MSRSENPTKAFTLSLTAGILILCNSALLGVAATWFPWIIPTLPGSADNSAVPFASLTAVGLTCGALVLLGAIMLRRPANKKAWGIVVIVFSISSVITGGGFIIGFILGTIGGALTLSRKPKPQPKPGAIAKQTRNSDTRLNARCATFLDRNSIQPTFTMT